MPSSRGSPWPGSHTQVSHICRRILYRLIHQGSPRILKWVTYPFSRGTSQPSIIFSSPCDAFKSDWSIFYMKMILKIVYFRLHLFFIFHNKWIICNTKFSSSYFSVNILSVTKFSSLYFSVFILSLFVGGIYNFSNWSGELKTQRETSPWNPPSPAPNPEISFFKSPRAVNSWGMAAPRLMG